MTNMIKENLKKADGASYEMLNNAQSAGNYLSHMSHDAGQKIGEMASDISKSTVQYVQTSRNYVKENPAKSVAIAAATGLVVGSFLTMYMRRSE